VSAVGLLLIGVALGFSLTVPPGPMNALIASRSSHSVRAGVVTGLGAMSSDAMLGAIVFLVETLVDLHGVSRVIYVLGAGTMAFLGYRLLRAAPTPPVAAPESRTFLQAVLVGLSNPFQILWWLTAGLASAYVGGAWLLGGLFGAIAVWIVVFPSAVHAGSARSPRVQVAVRYVSATMVLAFAGYFAWLAA
jgi:threonine/homoserine/homoserine lactone efflux protein